MISKKILIPVGFLAMAGVAVVGITQVNAQSASNPFSGLSKAIAQKFNLNESSVQDTITQYHKDHKGDMMKMHEQVLEDRLTQAVKDGKITDVQKTLILNKLKELQTKKLDLKNKTQAERKAAMDAERTALQDWAKQNNIDMKYLMGGFGMRGHMGGK